MKPVKSFEEYRESIRLHESKIGDIANKIKDTIVSAIKKIGQWFTGKGSLFLNSLIKQEKKMIPASVTIFPSSNDLKILAANKESVKVPKISDVAEFVKESFVSQFDAKQDYIFKIDEGVVPLKHPAGAGAPRDIDSAGFSKQVRNLIEATQAGKSVPPLLIWGAPGIGKTAIINAMAKQYDFSKFNKRMIVQDLATASEGDFLLPSKGEAEKEGRSTRLIVDWLPVYDSSKYSEEEGNKLANGEDGAGGIIFFDEIARCKPSVQAVIMKLCDKDRRINEWVLGDKWCIIAAANREKDQGDDDRTFNWSATLGNRFTQLNFAPSFEDWENLFAGQVNTEGEQNVIDEIIGFLKFRSDYFHKFDPDAEDISGGKPVIYPSPRKWSDASDKLKIAAWIAKKHNEKFDKKDIEETVAGEVGPEAATQYMAYLKLLDSVDPRDLKLIYSNPSKAPSLEKLDMDQQTVLMTAAVMSEKDNKALTDSELDNVTQWAVDFKNQRMAILFFKMFSKSHPELKKNDHWQDVCLAKLFDSYPKLSDERI